MLIHGLKTLLRRPEPDDLPFLTEWANDPQLEIMAYAYGTLPQSKSAIEETYLRQKGGAVERFVIVEPHEQRPIGIAMIHAFDGSNGNCQLGILIGAKELWNRGYGTDVRVCLTDFAFRHLNVHRVYGSTLAQNQAVIRMYQKCGAVVIGRLVEETYFDGAYHDIIVTSTSRDRFYEAVGEQLEKYKARVMAG